MHISSKISKNETQKVMSGPPQSIQEIKGEGLTWLKQQIKV